MLVLARLELAVDILERDSSVLVCWKGFLIARWSWATARDATSCNQIACILKQFQRTVI